MFGVKNEFPVNNGEPPEATYHIIYIPKELLQ
jgi:hypothetical protein